MRKEWSEWHSRQQFLLQVEPGDWIVHINTPEYGQCLTAKVTGTYGFDEGLLCEDRSDYRHFIPVDPGSVIQFERRDANILPSVNLQPRSRYQRVYAVEDFLQSLENLTNQSVTLGEEQLAGEFHLKQKTEPFLAEIARHVQAMNRSKELERFLAKALGLIPGVIDVRENGFGWGTDHGADLIVTQRSSLGGLEFENTIIVQVKSYAGNHVETNAVAQVAEGIRKYDGSAGMIFSTGVPSPALEEEVIRVAQELGKPIDLIAGDEIARFLLKHAPGLLFNL